MKNSSPIAKALNHYIKEEKRISQTQLAKELGVSTVSVNKWLSGGAIDIDKIPALCKALKISPNELFDLPSSNTDDFQTKLFEAYKKYPGYQDAIKKLLNIN